MPVEPLRDVNIIPEEDAIKDSIHKAVRQVPVYYGTTARSILKDTRNRSILCQDLVDIGNDYFSGHDDLTIPVDWWNRIKSLGALTDVRETLLKHGFVSYRDFIRRYREESHKIKEAWNGKYFDFGTYVVRSVGPSIGIKRKLKAVHNGQSFYDTVEYYRHMNCGGTIKKYYGMNTVGCCKACSQRFSGWQLRSHYGIELQILSDAQ